MSERPGRDRSERGAAADAAWPDVDVVMPIRNEADHLAEAVATVRSQDYPGRLRIFLGVGPSDDGTERVAAELSATGDDVVVVANPSGLTPSALNVAIRAGSAPIVVRVDGHSELSDGLHPPSGRDDAADRGRQRRRAPGARGDDAVRSGGGCGDDVVAGNRWRVVPRRRLGPAPSTPCSSACSTAQRSKRSGCSTSD